MKIVLITGASSDIGNSIAERLSKEGYFILYHFWLNERETIKIEIEKFLKIKADLTSLEEIEFLVNEVSKCKQLDAIIHCASLHEKQLYGLRDSEMFNKISFLNVFAPIKISKDLKYLLVKSDDPNIIFVSSSYSNKLGSINNIFYSSTKTAQLTVSRIFAREFRGIRSNSIIPGYVETSNYISSRTDEIIEEDKLKTLNNKLISVDQIAEAVFSVINNKGFNSSEITVDGGLYI